MLETAKDIYEIEVRRFGEFSQVGTKETQQKAKQFLKAFLRKDLSASGYISKEGKRIPFKNLGITDPEFRAGKNDPGLIVQKRSFRLKKSDKQVEEIQMFQSGKKKSPRRKSINWF